MRTIYMIVVNKSKAIRELYEDTTTRDLFIHDIQNVFNTIETLICNFNFNFFFFFFFFASLNFYLDLIYSIVN